MTRLFLTGATGYVGGEVLYSLASAKNSALQVSCLVRDSAKAQQVQAAYPEVRIVQGDLDDVDLLEQEARAAKIVLHLASTGHAASAQAIARGLQAQQQSSKEATYWIQLSGATLYAGEEIALGRFGYATDAVYDDVKDHSQILSIIRSNPKRVVENTVLSQVPSAVRTALLIGPLIYGPGRGPVNQRSVQAPEIAKATLQLGYGFKLNDGDNIWSNTHVQDLSSAIALLVSAAREGKEGLWNEDGVYNIENGELSFKELGTLISREAGSKEIKKGTDLERLDAKKADSLSGHASVLWGTNARTRASRIREKLSWSPSSPSLEDTIEDLVREELARLKGV